MKNSKLNMVTGAMSYSGKYITKILLENGEQVRTFTNHPRKQSKFNNELEIMPYNFDRPDKLAKQLKGVHTVYNTYWVRFNHGATTFGRAVANTKNLINASKDAGVKRFVHVSITNPSIDSNLDYFKGKAILENYIKNSGLSYAVVRPTVLFGKEDILINNIAYLLRRSPVFGIFGKGDYRLQPVSVEDLATLLVKCAQQKEDLIIDAVGSEIYAYADLVRIIKRAIGSRSFIMNIPYYSPLIVSTLLKPFIGDVLITKDEITGLADNLLVSEYPPTCETKFSKWIFENKDCLGEKYASEIGRHYKK